VACVKVLAGRNNVLLLGDELGDAGMADGVQNAGAVLKIGFLYDRVSLAQKYPRIIIISHHVVMLLLDSLTDWLHYVICGCISLQVEDRLEEFLNHFDIVLIDDQTMDVVNGILDLIL
jgi:hypothetical protein